MTFWQMSSTSSEYYLQNSTTEFQPKIGPEVKFTMVEITEEEAIQEAHSLLQEAIELLWLLGANPHDQ